MFHTTRQHSNKHTSQSNCNMGIVPMLSWRFCFEVATCHMNVSYMEVQKLQTAKKMQTYTMQLTRADDMAPNNLFATQPSSRSRIRGPIAWQRGPPIIGTWVATWINGRNKVNFSMRAGCHWYTWSRPVTHAFLPSALFIVIGSFRTQTEIIDVTQDSTAWAPPNPSRRTAQKKQVLHPTCKCNLI